MSGDEAYALIPIGQSKDDACLDVVFVHGITGDALTTWGAPQPDASPPITTLNLTGAPDPKNSPTFWPRWILEDVNDALQHSQAEAGHAPSASINVWSLGYPAPLWGLQDPYAYPESLRQAIRPSLSQLTERGIGRRTGSGVVFITHSLGGLVTKAILAECDEHAEHRTLLECTRGVAFLATPHSGAALSNLFGCLPAMIGAVGMSAKPISWLAGAPTTVGNVVQAATKFAGWFAQPSNQIQWLEKADPNLRLLTESYRKIAVERRIATRAFYETQPFMGLKPKLIAWVVDSSNADPGVPGCRPVPVPGCDHVTICKPDSRANTMYGSLKKWVAELATQQRRGNGVPVLHEQLPALLEQVRRDATFAAMKTVPKRLQDIPPDGQLRVDFSKKFRDVATEALKGDMGALLRENGDLVEALVISDWDLDQLVLFLWLGLQLKRDLERVSTVLRRQANMLEAEGGAPPTLILTYRSVDALRQGLSDGLRLVLPEFDTLHERIRERFSNYGDCDKGGRTRLLLQDGSRLLQPALQWKKPPKK